MDEQSVREHAQGHGQAMVDGDLRRAGSDLTEKSRDAAGAVLAELPKRIDSAELVELSSTAEGWVARIRYTGEGREVDVDSVWEEQDGRPMITDLRLV